MLDYFDDILSKLDQRGFCKKLLGSLNARNNENVPFNAAALLADDCMGNALATKRPFGQNKEGEEPKAERFYVVANISKTSQNGLKNAKDVRNTASKGKVTKAVYDV